MLIILALSCSASDEPPEADVVRAQAPDGFWEHWGDGQAELDGYRLKMPRYGELRDGEAVLVFVTETFTEGQRVKSDGGHPDEFPVIKLNDVRHFQTGIYDYDTMASVFVRLDGHDPLGLPTKADLGVQEWCGNVYDQLVLGDGQFARIRHSYFDGEADVRAEVPATPGGIAADAFPILVRNLAGSVLEPGQTRRVPWLPSLTDVRLAHSELAWTTATIARSASTEKRDVPAGTFDVYRVTVSVAESTSTWDVEAAYPHRIVAWSRSTGEEGVLTGSLRSKYWQTTKNGDEALRRDLGLP